MLLKKSSLHLRTGLAEILSDYLMPGFSLTSCCGKGWVSGRLQSPGKSLMVKCVGGLVAMGEQQGHTPCSHLFPTASPVLHSKTKLNRGWPGLASMSSDLSGLTTKSQMRLEYYLSKTVSGSSLLPCVVLSWQLYTAVVPKKQPDGLERNTYICYICVYHSLL